MTVKFLRIKECAEVRPGYSAKSAIVHDPAGSLQVITAPHLTRGESYRYDEGHKFLITPPRFSNKYLVAPGDILFMSRGANNYAVPIAEIPHPAIAPLTFFILKPKTNVVPGYLAWCLNQEPIKVRLNEIRTGAGTPMIPRREFEEITIPLPPLAAQQHIATLAELQAKEKKLLEQLVEETERLQVTIGKQILYNLTTSKQE